MEVVDIYAMGSIAEFEHDGDDQDRYYLPARSLCYQGLSPDLTRMFLLPDNPRVISYYQQLSKIYRELGVGEDFSHRNRPIFIPDTNYLLDKAVQEHVQLLQDHLSIGPRYRVLPYAHTQPLSSWMDSLRLRGFNIESVIPPRHYYDQAKSVHHRGGWGRHVRSPQELSFPERYDIPYPASSIGFGAEELLAAYEQVVTQTGKAEVFVKPVFSAGGFTLGRADSAQAVSAHYQSLKRREALQILGQETPIEIQSEITNIKALYSLQYDGEHVATPGGICKQLIDKNSWVGNVFNGDISEHLRHRAQVLFTRFKDGIHADGGSLKGHGGIDLASSQTGDHEQLVVIEHNGQRITGGHLAIALAEGFGVLGTYMSLKSPGEPTSDLESLWGIIKSLGFQFDLQQRRGVFPVSWMQGSGMLWAAGETESEAQRMLEKVYNKALSSGYIHEHHTQ